MKAGIAGAGIMGQLMAFHLLQAGFEVTIFDKSESINCSKVAAGLLTPVAELEKNDSCIYHMGMAALQTHWPAILACLDSPVYFKTDGSLLIAHPRDQQDLHGFMASIRHKIPDKQLLKSINHDEITQLEPALHAFQQGFYVSREGQIDNQQLMAALEHYLLKSGVYWQGNTTVSSVRAHCITVDSQSHYFDWVIDTRGLGAKDNFPHLRGIRGELVWLHAPDVSITRPVRILHPRYGLYIVPRQAHIYIIGASEIETEHYAPISVQTMLELLTACFAVNSQFKQAHILQSLTQCRPVLLHHRPEIVCKEGLIAINGLYRHGFLIAPTLAQEAMRGIQSNQQALEYPQIWR